jgi:hypothetical protein
MVWLNSIEQMRPDSLGKDWSKNHLWDIRFDDPAPPAPFDEWFPATDVRINKSALEVYTGMSPYTNFQLPQNSSLFDMSVTFLDVIDYTLEKYFSEWVNSNMFVNDGKNINYITEIARKVTVARLGNKRSSEIKDINGYLVFPFGNIDYEGKSDGAVNTYSVNFVIVGGAVPHPIRNTQAE